jgi:type VI secretion system protein ImpE
LDEAERLRPIVSGVCDGQPFAGLRDVDDLIAPVFEVLTSNGKYYWIPIERVELIEFRAPEHPRDLLWRRVHMVVRDGPDGEVFLPTLYCGSAADPDERFRMGRMTDWRGGDGSPVRGIGQRMFLIGDDGCGIMELQQITIAACENRD